MSDFINTEFLQQIAEDTINIAKKLGASQTAIHLGRSDGKSLNIRQGKIETLETIRDQSLAISVYLGQQKGSASCSDLSLSAIKRTVQKAYDIAKYTEGDDCFGLPDKARLLAEHRDLNLHYLWDKTTDELVKIAIECEQSALDYSPKISNSDGASISTEQTISVVANSLGFNDFSLESQHGFSCAVIAEAAGKMQSDYDYTSARNADNLSSAKSIGRQTAKRAVDKLNPKSITTGQYPIIFDATIASDLFGSFIQAISGSALYHKSTFLLDSLDTQIFPDFINLKEQPLLKGGLSSTAFDREGVATIDKFIVENGIVRSYILSSYTARRLKMQSTANAGGIFNLSVSTNVADQKTLLKEMGTGLLITEFMGSGTNLITGDYSRGAGGFWVENGIIQYPVTEITIAGNLKTMYQKIIGIAQDFDTRHNIVTGSVLIDKMTVSTG